MKFGEIIDWIGKNLGRLKTITLILIVCVFLVSLVRHGCDRQRIEDMVQRITGLNVRNDLLMQDIIERDSILYEKEARIIELKDSLSASEEAVQVLQSDYSHLEAIYEDLSDSLLTIPADTSYAFLVNEAYPYPGHLKYPFNEPQVKGIHLTYLEHKSMASMNENLLAQLDEMQYQLDVKDTIAGEQAEEIILMSKTRGDLDSIIINKDEIIQIQDKQITKQRRGKRVWQVATGVVIIILTAFAAGGG